MLDLPDNLTVTPRGSVVICEDGAVGNFIRILTRHGQLVDFAQNTTDRPNDEFAGVTISPDNRTLFVNIQSVAGRTFADLEGARRPGVLMTPGSHAYCSLPERSEGSQRAPGGASPQGERGSAAPPIDRWRPAAAAWPAMRPKTEPAVRPVPPG